MADDPNAGWGDPVSPSAAPTPNANADAGWGDATPPAPSAPPPAELKQGMPDSLTAAGTGIRESLQNTWQTLTGQAPGEVIQTPASEPWSMNDVSHPKNIAPKIAYQLGASTPALTGAAVGAGMGAAIPGLGETGIPELVGGGVGFVAGNFVNTYGPTLAAELKKTPNDKEGAFNRTWEKAGVDAGTNAASYVAFGALNPFKGVVKNMMFQSLVAQPTTSVAQKVGHNVIEGQPAMAGTGEAYVQGAASTVPLLAAHNLAKTAGETVRSALGKTKPTATPSPQSPGPDITPPEGEPPPPKTGTGRGEGNPNPRDSASQRPFTKRADVVDIDEDGNVVHSQTAPNEAPQGVKALLPQPETPSPQATPPPKFSTLFKTTDTDKGTKAQVQWLDANSASHPAVADALRAVSDSDAVMPPAKGKTKLPDVPEVKAIQQQRAYVQGAMMRLSNMILTKKPTTAIIDQTRLVSQAGDQLRQNVTAFQNAAFRPKPPEAPAAAPAQPTAPPAPAPTATPPSPPPLSLDELTQARADIDYARSPLGAPEGMHQAIGRLGGIRTRDAKGAPLVGGIEVERALSGYKPKPYAKRLINNAPDADSLAPDDMRGALKSEGWFGNTSDEFGPRAMETGNYPGDDIEDLYGELENIAKGQPSVHPSTRDAYTADVASRQGLDQEMHEAGITAGDRAPLAARKLAQYRASRPAEEPAPVAQAPAGSEELDEEGLYQGFFPDAAHSAQQLAAAREAEGLGKITPKAAQQEPGGMFSQRPEPSPPDLMDELPGWEERSKENLTPEYQAHQRDAFIAEVNRLADRMFPQGTKVEIVAPMREGDRMVTARVSYENGAHLMRISMDTPNLTRTMQHEAIHIIRQYMPEKDWAALEAAAIRGHWINRYAINSRYASLSPMDRLEESIAFKFGDHLNGKSKAAGKVAGIFNRIAAFLQKITAAVRRHFGAKASINDIFSNVREGVYKGNEPRGSFEGVRYEKDKETPKSSERAEPIPGSEWGPAYPPPPKPGGGGGERVPVPGEESGSGSWREGGPGLGKFLSQVEDELFRLGNASKVDMVNALKALKSDSLPKGLLDRKTEKNIYNAVEEETKFPGETRDHIMTPEEARLHDNYIQPIRDEANREFNSIRLRGGDPDNVLGRTVGLDGYMHRMRVGDEMKYTPYEGPKDTTDPITGKGRQREGGPGGRGLGRKAASMYERSPFFMKVSADGSKEFVEGDQYKDGQKFEDKDGKVGVVRAATSEEIEKGTKGAVQYHKNAFINSLTNLLTLRRISRNLDMLDALTKHPTFQENSVVPEKGQRPPPGWRETDIPQFRGRYMNPRMANMFDDYYDIGRNTNRLESLLGNINRALVRMIFANPVSAFVGHGGNVAVHAIVDRGWSNFDPRKWPASALNFGRATNQVIHIGPLYKQLMMHGASFQYASQFTRDFHATAMKLMQGEMEKNPKTWAEIARAAGTTPKILYNWLSDTSSKGLWMGGDILTMWRMLDNMTEKGMDPRTAIRETEKGMPNYRIPTEAWEGPGGREFSELMKNPNITIFGRYHYSVMRAFAHQVADAVARQDQALSPPPPLRGENRPDLESSLAWEGEGKPYQEAPQFKQGPGGQSTRSRAGRKALAAGQLLALYVMYNQVYPMLDKAWQLVLRNKHASMRRAGPTMPLNAFSSWANDNYKHPTTVNDLKGLYNLYNGLVGLAPAPQFLGSTYYFNTDPLTGKHIINPHGSVAEISQELASSLVTTPFFGQEGEEYLGGRKSWIQLGGEMAGVNAPTPAQWAMERKYAVKDTQADTKAQQARSRKFWRSVGGKEQAVMAYLKGELGIK